MVKRGKVAVLISGRGSNAMALIKASQRDDCSFEIVLVASDSPGAEGLALAAAEGIPAVGVPKPTPKDHSQFYAALDKIIRDHGANYVALAGFMRILPPDFVAKWQGRMLNIHPSLLPKYKGLHTHARALAAGEREVGCSVHVVTAELDDGPVLGQAHVAVVDGDTPDTLAARVLVAEHQLYARVLAEFVVRGHEKK